MLSNETCLLELLAKISNFFHCMFHLSINLVFDGVFVKFSFPLHIGKLFLVSSSLILNLLFKIFEWLSWYYVNVRIKNLSLFGWHCYFLFSSPSSFNPFLPFQFLSKCNFYDIFIFLLTTTCIYCSSFLSFLPSSTE